MKNNIKKSSSSKKANSKKDLNATKFSLGLKVLEILHRILKIVDTIMKMMNQ